MTGNVQRARESMNPARAERFAVGAFNVDNQETMLAIARAAEAKHAPMLAELYHADAEIIGLANMRSLVDNYRAEYRVEVHVNLDRGPSVEAAKAGIDAGFPFIHIDHSHANRDATDEQIAAATRAVVDHVAETTEALVEREPQHFRSSSSLHDEEIDYDELGKAFLTPDRAHAFVDATGVDTIAPSVGNLAGPLPGAQAARPRTAAADSRGDRHQHQPGRRQRHAEPLFRSGCADRRQQGNVNPALRYAYRTTLKRQPREHPDGYGS